MKDKEFKHKRNYNEMLNQSNSLSNSLSNKINHLPFPKIKYYTFLNNKIIGKEETKFLDAIKMVIYRKMLRIMPLIYILQK